MGSQCRCAPSAAEKGASSFADQVDSQAPASPSDVADVADAAAGTSTMSAPCRQAEPRAGRISWWN